jgi:hypothetical protein
MPAPLILAPHQLKATTTSAGLAFALGAGLARASSRATSDRE